MILGQQTLNFSYLFADEIRSYILAIAEEELAFPA
jgi:hypothetical protein